MFWRWAVAAVLLILSFLYLNAAASYFWAAGLSTLNEKEAYLQAGYIDFAAACVLFVGFVVMLVKNIRRIKRERKNQGSIESE